LREDPVDEVVDLVLILRLDDGVILFVTVLELDLLARRDVQGDPLARIRLALVLGCDVLVCRPLLLAIHRVTLEAVALPSKLLRGGGIDGGRVGRRSEGNAERGGGEGVVERRLHSVLRGRRIVRAVAQSRDVHQFV
jgi:hypothetical protein